MHVYLLHSLLRAAAIITPNFKMNKTATVPPLFFPLRLRLRARRQRKSSEQQHLCRNSPSFVSPSLSSP
jgi:hypothetical protein